LVWKSNSTSLALRCRQEGGVHTIAECGILEMADYDCLPIELNLIVMKKTYTIIALIFIITGCQFQKPDNLKMVNPAELHQIMQNDDIFLVDVHTPQQRHIKDTDLFIPYNEIDKYIEKFPKDKNTAIYLYCEGGPMGNAAAKTLHEFGYQNLFNLEGGARAWKKAGFDFE